MSIINYVDICCGLAWGDEAKGKIVMDLLIKNKYDWVCRWNGGSNAGHTIYLNKQKYNTNIVPSGIFLGVKCYIGPDCYINIDDLEKEMIYLKQNGCDLSLIKVSPKAHIITDEHKKEDANKYMKTQGSTGKGIAPCSKDKFSRVGIRLQDIKDYNYNVFDSKINIFKEGSDVLSGNILCEGAQGFWLDINYGEYPYVTSAYTLPYSACGIGFPPQKIRNIYGAAKIYDTRVGVDPYFDKLIINEEYLKQIAIVGDEFGTTTGRERKVNWLNLTKLIDAINLSGCSHLILSKVDILEKIKIYRLIFNNKIHMFNTIDIMKAFVEKIIMDRCELLNEIIWSNNPYNI
jgi:adenylosuccinate synthase